MKTKTAPARAKKRFVTFTRRSTGYDFVHIRTEAEHKAKRNRLPADWVDYVFQMQPNAAAAKKRHARAVEAYEYDPTRDNY